MNFTEIANVKDFNRKALEFNKAVFETNFNAFVTVQDNAEKLVKMALDAMTWVPEETKKPIYEYSDLCKKTCTEYKKTAEAGFNKIVSFFNVENANTAKKQ